MNTVPPVSAVAGPVRSARFHQWRSRKDRAVRWLITIGGVAVICAVVLIFFYLLYVVFPLFLPARAMERMGDRCGNIAEYIFYLVHGRDIRHISLDDAMAEIDAEQD